MAEEPENLTVRLLQEIRSEMGEFRSELDAVKAGVRDMRVDLTRRVDGNTLILNMLVGMGHEHEDRLTKLEAR